MKNEKNIAVLKEMAEKVRICVFTTIKPNDEFHSRPMAIAEIEDDGSLWFFTNEYSAKSKEISKDNEVALGFSDPGNNTYIFINGKAELVDEMGLKNKFFNPAVKAWFPEGVDDPRLILIKVTPSSAEYWEGSSSKIIEAFHMLKAIVTGQQSEEGKNEKLSF